MMDAEILAEQEAEELFVLVKEYVENGSSTGGLKRLEDLANEYPNNKTINTYNDFANAITFYDRNGMDKASSFYEYFENNLALVDINFSGKYHEFISSFIEENMGTERY